MNMVFEKHSVEVLDEWGVVFYAQLLTDLFLDDVDRFDVLGVHGSWEITTAADS